MDEGLVILKQTVAALGVAAMLSACASSFKDPGSIGQHARGAQPRFDPSVPPMQCVPYARKKSGVKIFGDAYTWWDKAAGRFERRIADPTTSCRSSGSRPCNARRRHNDRQSNRA